MGCKHWCVNYVFPLFVQKHSDHVTSPEGFAIHDLNSSGHLFFTWALPARLVLNAKKFLALWENHPPDFHPIKMHGRLLRTPRWQQAFGADYYYSGNVNKALPIPSSLTLVHTWAKDTIDDRLNGILLNWYDGSLGHYIGRHRDSTVNVIPGTPIVTISLGETRTFRLRPWKDDNGNRIDFKASNGAVFVMPFATNLSWTHEVPSFSKSKGLRISITLRAFKS